MWSRSELKQKAKAVLKGNYWTAFWISLVLVIASGGGGGGGGSSYGSNNETTDSVTSSTPEISGWIILIIILVVLGILIFAAALRICVGYPLEVGGRRYFVRSAEYSDSKRCFGFAFEGSHYKGIVLTMLLKGVQNFLWYLLLFIPGVIKWYAYRMVPYILADNPNIGCKRAIELSNKMTAGHKFNMFVLDLSFIGWFLLGMLALLVGTLFVLPYYNATLGELYLVLRKNILDSGATTIDELRLNQLFQQSTVSYPNVDLTK